MPLRAKLVFSLDKRFNGGFDMGIKDSIIEVVNETTMEVLAVGIVGITMGVAATQALRGNEITIPFELATMAASFFFMKKAVQ